MLDEGAAKAAVVGVILVTDHLIRKENLVAVRGNIGEGERHRCERYRSKKKIMVISFTVIGRELTNSCFHTESYVVWITYSRFFVNQHSNLTTIFIIIFC